VNSADRILLIFRTFLILPLLIASAASSSAAEEYSVDSWYMRHECHLKNCGDQFSKVSCTINGQGPIIGYRYLIGDGVEFHWLGGLAATYMRYTFEKDGSTSYRDFFGRKWTGDFFEGSYASVDGRIAMNCITIK